MANWSLDLPRLTDRDVVKSPFFTRGETSLTTRDVTNPEGFGNESEMESVTNFKKSSEGVFAVASTTYALKLLVEFLASPTVNIPVRALDVGTITPVEIRKAYKMSKGKCHFSTILAFQVDMTLEASQLAKRLRVKVIWGNELATLCQRFKEHIKELGEEETMDDIGEAPVVFPCVLCIVPNLVFNKDHPIVLGVFVAKGFIKVGIPICNPRRGCLDIGRIAWIEKDQRSVEVARVGETVVIKIVASNPEEEGRSFGSHFDITDILVSHLSRESINVLKASYKDVLSITDWKLVSNLKCIFNIK